METRNFSQASEQAFNAGITLDAADLETLAHLMAELKDITLSRSTFLAASELLRRCGLEGGPDTLVRPEHLDN